MEHSATAEKNGLDLYTLTWKNVDNVSLHLKNKLQNDIQNITSFMFFEKAKARKVSV